jgi:hypothetical protein
MTTFRKVNLQIQRSSGYGHYVITANYKDQCIEAHTTNSKAFDWLDDDSNKQLHQEAKRYCYNRIVEAYNNI